MPVNRSAIIYPAVPILRLPVEWTAAQVIWHPNNPETLASRPGKVNRMPYGVQGPPPRFEVGVRLLMPECVACRYGRAAQVSYFPSMKSDVPQIGPAVLG